MAAHDQLLFTARQKVDALSAQMVALQAEVGITADTRASIDLPALLNRLKQPLAPNEQPKAFNPMEHNITRGEESHPMIIHSADPYTFFQPPSHSDGNVKRSIGLRHSNEVPPQRRSLQENDVNNMLDWVHRQKNSELAKTYESNADAFNAKRSADYSRKFVRDFVSNMQNLNNVNGNSNENIRNQLQEETERQRWNRKSDTRRRSLRSERNRRRASE